MRHYIHDSYQEGEVLSASPLQLICLLYRAAVESIAEARRCVAARDILGRARAINKAYQIVAELMFSLDRHQEPELSRQLAALYDYIQRLLIDANCRQVDGPLAEAQILLTTLQEAWENCERPGRTQILGERECEYAPVSCAG